MNNTAIKPASVRRWKANPPSSLVLSLGKTPKPERLALRWLNDTQSRAVVSLQEYAFGELLDHIKHAGLYSPIPAFTTSSGGTIAETQLLLKPDMPVVGLKEFTIARNRLVFRLTGIRQISPVQGSAPPDNKVEFFVSTNKNTIEGFDNFRFALQLSAPSVFNSLRVRHEETTGFVFNKPRSSVGLGLAHDILIWLEQNRIDVALDGCDPIYVKRVGEYTFDESADDYVLRFYLADEHSIVNDILSVKTIEDMLYRIAETVRVGHFENGEPGGFPITFDFSEKEPQFLL